MSFLPIVERELIEAARRRGTHWIRLLAAAAGLGLGALVLLNMRAAPPAELGMDLFRVLAGAAYFYCLFVGVFRTADCLSEEKREGTLGLLFLTDLKGYDIVLGKLAATSLNAFYGLLALFPVMAIPLLLGGVTLGEFWRMVLVSLNLLGFSLAVGMFCSSLSRDERRALVVAFLIVLFFAVGVPLLVWLGYAWRRARPWPEYLLIPSPSYAAVMAFEATFKGGSGPNYFYRSVCFTHGLSWALLQARPEVSSAEARDGQVKVTLVSQEIDQSIVAETLVRGGAKLIELREDELGLEEVFLRVTRGETQ